MTTRVDVFVDYVCPYCFLVENALEELKRDREVEVRIRPFELRPDPVPTLRPEDDYLPRVWHASVYPMARSLGYDITLPSVSPQPRTEKAFLVLQLAGERGKAAEYSEAMFKAFFQNDRDIGDDGVIADVAVSVGLELPDVEHALSSEQRRARHKADLDYARGTLRLDAVPAILIEGELLRGVPTADRLKKAVDAVGQDRHGPQS